MPLRTLQLILLCLGFASVGHTVGAAAANSPPTADEVEQFIATTLPGYWKVDQLSLSDPVDYGNPVEPEWRWRYEALIAPKEPLYVDGGRHEGVVLLEPSLSPESPQTLYGVAIATFHAGTWRGEARHENRPFDHGGQPASFFPGLAVVVGSPEERELREATRERIEQELEAAHKDALAREKEAHRAALERLKTEHDAERERREAEHQNELATASAQRSERLASLESLKAEHDAERERREVEHQNELATAAARHAEQLAALEADLNAEAERRRVEITETEKLTELSTEASHKLSALHAAEAEMLAASERLHEARRVGLKKLFDMLSVVTGSDDYLALLDTASESQLDWMRVAVLRHGLGSDNLALGVAARRHLLQANVEINPDLQYLVADHVQDFIGRPEMLPIVEKIIPPLVGDQETLQTITAALPSISQWANEVVDFSSQFGEGDRSAKHILGEPNTSGCRDYWKAWMPISQNPGFEFVRVRFGRSVWFPEIGVHENLNVGAIRKIILWDADGNGTEYDVQDPLNKCPGIAKFQFDKYTKPVNELTVVLDTRTVQGSIQIDAISLSGRVLEVK